MLRNLIKVRVSRLISQPHKLQELQRFIDFRSTVVLLCYCVIVSLCYRVCSFHSCVELSKSMITSVSALALVRVLS